MSFVGNLIKPQLKSEYKAEFEKVGRTLVLSEADEDGEVEEDEEPEDLSSEDEEGEDSEQETDDAKQLEAMFENLHLE